MSRSTKEKGSAVSQAREAWKGIPGGGGSGACGKMKKEPQRWASASEKEIRWRPNREVEAERRWRSTTPRSCSALEARRLWFFSSSQQAWRVASPPLSRGSCSSMQEAALPVVPSHTKEGRPRTKTAPWDPGSAKPLTPRAPRETAAVEEVRAETSCSLVAPSRKETLTALFTPATQRSEDSLFQEGGIEERSRRGRPVTLARSNAVAAASLVEVFLWELESKCPPVGPHARNTGGQDTLCTETTQADIVFASPDHHGTPCTERSPFSIFTTAPKREENTTEEDTAASNEEDWGEEKRMMDDELESVGSTPLSAHSSSLPSSIVSSGVSPVQKTPGCRRVSDGLATSLDLAFRWGGCTPPRSLSRKHSHKEAGEEEGRETIIKETSLIPRIRYGLRTAGPITSR